MQKSIHTREYADMCKILRVVRVEAGLTQRDLAARLGLPHSVIAKIETAERRIDPIELVRLLRACDTDPCATFRLILDRVPKAAKRGGRP